MMKTLKLSLALVALLAAAAMAATPVVTDTNQGTVIVNMTVNCNETLVLVNDADITATTNLDQNNPATTMAINSTMTAEATHIQLTNIDAMKTQALNLAVATDSNDATITRRCPEIVINGAAVINTGHLSVLQI